MNSHRKTLKITKIHPSKISAAARAARRGAVLGLEELRERLGHEPQLPMKWNPKISKH